MAVPGGGIVQRKKPLELHFFNKADTVGTLLPPPLRISGGVWASEEMVWLFQHWWHGGKKDRNLPRILLKWNFWDVDVHPKKKGWQIWPSKQKTLETSQSLYIYIYRSLSTIPVAFFAKKFRGPNLQPWRFRRGSPNLNLTTQATYGGPRKTRGKKCRDMWPPISKWPK